MEREAKMWDELREKLLIHRVKLADKISLTSLWDRLIETKVITVALANKIKFNRTRKEQVGELLDFIEKRSDEDLDRFIQALNDDGQRHMVDLLTQDHDASSEHEEAFVNILRSNRVALVEELQITPEFLDCLLRYEVLTAEIKDFIALADTRQEQVRRLLDYLLTRTPADYEAFCDAAAATRQNQLLRRFLQADWWDSDEDSDDDNFREFSMQGTHAPSPYTGVDHGTQETNDTFFELLITNKENIIDKLTNLSEILDYLVALKGPLLTQEQKERIQEETLVSKCRKILSFTRWQMRASKKKTACEQTRKLVEFVQEKGEEACRHFFAAIFYHTDQTQLVTLPPALKLKLFRHPPLIDITSLAIFKTLLKMQYCERIRKSDEAERGQYGNVVQIAHHEPVIISYGKRKPDYQSRQGIYEFSIAEEPCTKVTLTELLAPEEKSRPRSVLLLGGPGMGKSSLCLTILDRYSRAQWKQVYQHVFFIPMKELDFEKMTPLSIADLLLDHCGVSVSIEQKQKLISELDEHQDSCLFILDGYDETEDFMTCSLQVAHSTTTADPQVILANLVRGNLFPKAQILLTSRPCEKTEFPVDATAELSGLSSQSVKSLVQKTLPTELADEYIKILNANHDIASLIRIPVNAQKMLSYISWVAQSAENAWNQLPYSKSTLYSNQMLPVLKQCLRLRGIVNLDVKRVWKHPHVKQLLYKLTKLVRKCFWSLSKKHIVFTDDDVQSCGLTVEEITACALMTSFKKQDALHPGYNFSVLYVFTHLTNLEWCGGLDIVHFSIAQIDTLIKENDGHLDVILLFALGLLGSKDGQHILKCLYGMTRKRCLTKADQMMKAIVQSDRCKHPGGALYAIEIFCEGEFQDPRPLLPLLSPEAGVLQLKGVALHNHHTSRYLVSKINAMFETQSQANSHDMKVFNVVRIQFKYGVVEQMVQNMLREVSKLHGLDSIDIAGIGTIFLNGRSLSVTVAYHSGKESTTVMQGILAWLCNDRISRNIILEPDSIKAYRGQNSNNLFTSVVYNDGVPASILQDVLTQLCRNSGVVRLEVHQKGATLITIELTDYSATERMVSLVWMGREDVSLLQWVVTGVCRQEIAQYIDINGWNVVLHRESNVDPSPSVTAGADVIFEVDIAITKVLLSGLSQLGNLFLFINGRGKYRGFLSQILYDFCHSRGENNIETNASCCCVDLNIDGICEAAMGVPMQMLALHGELSEAATTRLIESTGSRALSLYNTGNDECKIPPSCCVANVTEFMHVGELIDMSIDTAQQALSSNGGRVLSTLTYHENNADVICSNLATATSPAIGLMMFSNLRSAFEHLCDVICRNHKLKSISLTFVLSSRADHRALLLHLLERAVHLEELWVMFWLRTPSTSLLRDIGRRAARHSKLTRLALMGVDVTVNINEVLDELIERGCTRLNHLIATRHSGHDIDDSLAAGWSGSLLTVENDPRSIYYARLIYSKYLMLDVPSHMKHIIDELYILSQFIA